MWAPIPFNAGNDAIAVLLSMIEPMEKLKDERGLTDMEQGNRDIIVGRILTELHSFRTRVSAIGAGTATSHDDEG